MSENKGIANGINIFGFASDDVAEVEGVEKVWNGITYKVARANNKKFLKVFREEYDKRRDLIEDESEPEKANEAAEEVNKKAFCSAILVGWEGIVDENGEEFPYSVENAMKVYEKVKDFIVAVTRESSKSENYRVSNLKKDSEKLKK